MLGVILNDHKFLLTHILEALKSMAGPASDKDLFMTSYMTTCHPNMAGGITQQRHLELGKAAQ